MVDFAARDPYPNLRRCRRRARAARNAARLLLVALGGLVGTALALEPKMATELRTTVSELHADLRGTMADVAPFVAAIRIGEGGLRPSQDDTVAQADTSLLRP